MSSPECRRWRELIGPYVLGHLDPGERAALQAHLDGCPECRAEAEELNEVITLLPYADPARIEGAPLVPRGLGRQVFARIGEERRAARNRRRFGLGAFGAATAAAVATLALATHFGQDSKAPRLALRSPLPGAAGSVELERRPWGSQIELTASGLPTGTYRVWLERPDGTRAPAGSFRGVAGRSLNVLLASSMATERVAAVGVSGPRGRTMLYATV